MDKIVLTDVQMHMLISRSGTTESTINRFLLDNYYLSLLYSNGRWIISGTFLDISWFKLSGLL